MEERRPSHTHPPRLGFQVPSTSDRSERASQGKLPIAHMPASSCSWVVLFPPLLAAKSPGVPSLPALRARSRLREALPVSHFLPSIAQCMTEWPVRGMQAEGRCAGADSLPTSGQGPSTIPQYGANPICIPDPGEQEGLMQTAKLSGGHKEEPTSSLC